MISTLAIVGLVFALLCVAAWYNQPERYEFIGVPDDYKCPDCERMTLTWHHAYVSFDTLGKAARDASVKVVEFKEANMKEVSDETIPDQSIRTVHGHVCNKCKSSNMSMLSAVLHVERGVIFHMRCDDCQHTFEA